MWACMSRVPSTELATSLHCFVPTHRSEKPRRFLRNRRGLSVFWQVEPAKRSYLVDTSVGTWCRRRLALRDIIEIRLRGLRHRLERCFQHLVELGHEYELQLIA